MAKTSDEFLQKFYTLDGLTIDQRQKNFFKLLHQSASFLINDEEALCAISKNLKPRTHLESLYRVDFLIYFRRKNELFDIIREGDDILVSKIAKQVWFFKEFENIEAEKLVNETLPCLSYSVRMKILRKLSRYLSEEKFEEIFDCLVERYGFFRASQFITGCGPEKVREFLKLYPLKLNSTQLRILYGKDPKLIEDYFSKPENNLRNRLYKRLVKYLFDNDRVLYSTLNEKMSISITYGRRATKKFVEIKKDEIIAKPYEFSYIDMKAVIRKLGKDSVQLFKNALPEKLQNCINLNNIISSFPRRYHYSLFIKIFPLHYNIKLEDHGNLINESILNMITDNFERARFAQIKVQQGDDFYIKYLTVQESIPLLKEKINLTSDIHLRGNLIKQLIETCRINNDMNALLSVLKYFNWRHKNDDLSVHLNFINNIERLFGFQDFTEEMWICLNELLAIHLLKFDETTEASEKIQTMSLFNMNLGISNEQKLRYLEFLFKQNVAIDTLLADYFSKTTSFPNYEKFQKNFCKHLLLYAINQVNKDHSFRCNLISEINNWNLAHEDDQMHFYDFPPLLEAFYKVVTSEKWYLYYLNGIDRFFSSRIFTTEENRFRNEFLEIYWNSKRHISFNDLQWFLKYDPVQIAKHLDLVLDYYLEADLRSTRKRELEFFKKYTHLELYQYSIEFYLRKLNSDAYLEKHKLIPYLSVLMKPRDFAEIAVSYKPENKKLDLRNEKEVKLYKLQCAVAFNFKHTRSTDCLPVVLQYCVGDYFKYALSSLYSLLYRTPETELSQYLELLSKKAVSVRKHSLFLTCELSTPTDVAKYMKQLSQQEEVLSLQKHLFSATIKYFVKNPSDQFFELVKINMLAVTKTDEESLKSIVDNFNKIPQTFKASYLVCAWEHFEKTIEIWQKLKPFKERLLSHMGLDICSKISLEFGLKMIDQHFLTENNNRDLSQIAYFLFNFLRTQKQKSVIFDKIFTSVDNHKTKVLEFINSWFLKIMELDADVSYFGPFVQYYEKNVSLVENFPDYIKLFLLKTKLKYSPPIPLDSFATDLLMFFDSIIQECGVFVISLFAETIGCEIRKLLKKQATKLDLCSELIRRRPEKNIAMLILPLIYKPCSDKIEQVKKFDSIITEISKVNDLGVQINLKNILRHLH